MTERNDRDYFTKRAQQERAIASTSEDNSAALAHLKLADAYEARIQESAGEPVMAIPTHA